MSELIGEKTKGYSPRMILATGLLLAGSMLIPDVRRAVLPESFRTFFLSLAARTLSTFSSPKDKMLLSPKIWHDDARPIGADNFVEHSWITDPQHSPFSVLVNGEPIYINGTTFNFYPNAPKEIQLSPPLEFQLSNQRTIKPVIEGYQFYFLEDPKLGHLFFRYDETSRDVYSLTQIVDDSGTINLLEGYLRAQKNASQR